MAASKEALKVVSLPWVFQSFNLEMQIFSLFLSISPEPF